MGYAKIFRDYTGPNRKFSSFCIGEFFMSDDDIFVKVADDKALLSQSERMCLNDALTTVDNDDDFPCQDGDFVIKMV